MHIYSHIIKDDEIIGIGPLMRKDFRGSFDELYGARQYLFSLYTRHQTIEIKMNTAYTNTNEDKNNDQAQQEIIAFQNAYNETVKKVLSIIGEQEIQNTN
ncbi:MAG TPA: hypothetical protein PL045_03675 [Chitinophagaceae bacterium]|nr:hypothetical protein [Chitinophagaceae bacterium]